MNAIRPVDCISISLRLFQLELGGMVRPKWHKKGVKDTAARICFSDNGANTATLFSGVRG